jgi:hypothetical protein
MKMDQDNADYGMIYFNVFVFSFSFLFFSCNLNLVTALFIFA